jgi:Na+-translocating ferredoxin:NAD+ oxidoreductase RnfG subunit
MKKLFEKPLFHYTFVLTVVSIVCGLVIGGVNAITAPIIQGNKDAARALAYSEILVGIESFEELLEESDPVSIRDKVAGFDKDGKLLGYIFEVQATNSYTKGGPMSFVVSVNQQGVIIAVKFLSVNQTFIPRTIAVLEEYVGLPVDSDYTSGATIVITTRTINQMMNDVALAFSTIDTGSTNPLDAWFGAGHQMAPDATFTPTDNIIAKQIVSDSNGVVIGGYYHLRGTSEYNFDSGASGTINLYVGIDLDGVILGVDLPKDEYGHTTSNAYYPKVVTYANSTVGQNVKDFNGPGDLSDLETGPSASNGVMNSRNLVDVLLTALGGSLE